MRLCQRLPPRWTSSSGSKEHLKLLLGLLAPGVPGACWKGRASDCFLFARRGCIHIALLSINIRNRPKKMQEERRVFSSSHPSLADLLLVTCLDFCGCLRLIPKAEVGKAALEKCPKETGHLNSHRLPQPLSGRFQLRTTVQPIRLPACFSTSSRRIRKENKGS